MFRTLIAAGAAVAALSGAAFAQDYRLSPSFGQTTLQAGFTGDPRTVSLQSGGPIDASGVASGCRGYIADAPDYRVSYTAGPTFPLILSVEAGADTTPVITAPNGAWYCDDDSGNGVNSSVRFSSPQSGRHDIWVGAHASASLQQATLFISEVSSR
ncbi:MAG: peptidase S1 [Oceanicaulis sp.]